MRQRSILRTAVLAAVAAGAVLAPSAAAFADTPAPTASPADRAEQGTPENPVLIKDASKPIGDIKLGESSTAPRGVAPRGGVAAGERPVAASDGNTAVLAGSAAAALLVAGAGTLVLRRRTTAQPGH
ncbi:sortase-dependent protein [Streptomyces sp. NPDC052042]|uniref:sortase-dependent protein n=1 Tax=Streptomyces sp. NPDC052042 TaxID=3365683 RepID=UPI0037D47D82